MKSFDKKELIRLIGCVIVISIFILLSYLMDT